MRLLGDITSVSPRALFALKKKLRHLWPKIKVTVKNMTFLVLLPS